MKPYFSHTGPVRTLATVDAFTFLSGGNDGIVKQFDTREKPRTRSPSDSSADLHPWATIVRQRPERGPVIGSGGAAVGVAVKAMAVDPVRPWLFATGGGDPLGEAGSRCSAALPPLCCSSAKSFLY